MLPRSKRQKQMSIQFTQQFLLLCGPEAEQAFGQNLLLTTEAARRSEVLKLMELLLHCQQA